LSIVAWNLLLFVRVGPTEVRMRKFLSVGVACGALLASNAAQADWVIDFEADGNGNVINPGSIQGQVINDQYSSGNGGIPGSNGVAVDIIANNYRFGSNNGRTYDPAKDVAAAFNTDLSGTNDPDLEAPFTDVSSFGGDVPDGTFNPGNVLIIQENYSGCFPDLDCDSTNDEGRRPAGFVDFIFNQAVTIFSLDFFDVETDEDGSTVDNEIHFFNAAGDLIGVNGATTLNLFDLLGGDSFDDFASTEIDVVGGTLQTSNNGNDRATNSTSEFFTPDTGGNNHWDRLVFNGDLGIQDVAFVRVEFGGSGAIDNLRGDVQLVPVPASVLLFGAGFAVAGGAGWVRRRKSKKTA